MSVSGISYQNTTISNYQQAVKQMAARQKQSFDAGYLYVNPIGRSANQGNDSLKTELLDAYRVMSQKAGAASPLVEQREQMNNAAPYSYLAKDGIIEYNGVVFVCDDEHNALHLGDTSNMKNCINISLSGGGSLIVNRDNIGDLAKAIGMFSPEDVNLIMRAIARDAKIQQMQNEIDEETSGIGEAGEAKEETKDSEEGVMELVVTGRKEMEEQ